MSWLDDKLLGLDLETTGVDPETALPVSFALAEYDLGVRGRVRTALVDPGEPIPAGATAIHGITDEMVAERGGDLARTIDGLVASLLEASLASVPVVGMNVRYDLTVIDACHRRLNDGVGLRDLGWDGAVLDALVIDRHVDQYRKGSRKLDALCAHYGVTLSDAHSAAADAIASIEVVLAIARRHAEISNLSLDELHGFQAGWHRAWAEGFSEYRVKKGEEPLDECEFSWPIRCEPERDETDGAITDGQRTHLLIKLKDDHGIEGRRERLFLLSAILERPIETSNDLTAQEYRSFVAWLDLMVGTPGVATVMADLPPDGSTASPVATEAETPTERPERPTVDSAALLESSTVATVVAMDAETVRSWCERCGIAVREGGHPKAKLIPVGKLRMLLIPAVLRLRQADDVDACALF